MSDAVEQWRAYLTSGRSFSVPADRRVIAAKLRANLVGLVASAVLAALSGAGLVVLAATDAGRAATYVAVGALVVALLVVVVRLAGFRKRLTAYATASDPLFAVSTESIALSGIPPIPWSDVLGVLASDLTDEYAAARGIGGWLRRTAIRTGGGMIGLAVGIAHAEALRAAATGGLVGDLIVVFGGHGQAIVYLDHALSVEQSRQVVTAVKVAAWLNGVGFVTSNRPKDGIEVAAKIMRGERLEPQP